MSQRVSISFMLWLFAALPSWPGDVLTLGSISSKPNKEIQTFHPLAQYLARNLKDMGITEGKVVVAEDIEAMATRMRDKQVDVYIDSPYPVIAVSQRTEAKIILRRWKGGEAEYQSVIIVQADSPIRSLDDLKGRVVAFEDRYSTTGYLLPLSVLRGAGHRLRELPAGDTKAAPDETGFVFSGGKETTLLWVARGRTAAGAVGGHDLSLFEKNQPGTLRVIHRTKAFPRQLVCIRRDLDPKLAQRIKDVLTRMENTEEGRAVLAAFENTTRFDEIPGGATKALAPIIRLMGEETREARGK